MKKYTILLALATSLSFNVASAAQCTAPTPPIQYSTKTVSVYSHEGTQSDGAYVYGNGMVLLPNGGGTVQSPTKQIQVQIDSSNNPTYQADLLSYNLCLQVNTMDANRSSLSSYSNTTEDTSIYKQVCPYPVQPPAQLSQTIVKTASFGNGTTIKQYADGSYALFSQSGQYAGFSNSSQFDSARIYQEVKNKITDAVSSNNLGNIRNLRDLEKTEGDIGESIQTHIYMDLSEGYCVPPKAIKITPHLCQANAKLDKDNLCRCVEGFGGGSGKNEGKCIPFDQALKESGIFLYNDPNSHESSSGYECNDGYVANEGNSKCISFVDLYTKPQTIPKSTLVSNTILVKKNTVPQAEHQKGKPEEIDFIKNISTSTISTDNLANSTSGDPKTPESHREQTQKHWYQWLNPFSWFR